MPQAVIENPIINSPFAVPKRHFRFTEEGITNEIVSDRRSSSYFIPIARPKFTIPYTINVEEHQYTPDFIAVIDDSHGYDDLLNLIVEVSGEPKKDKAAKVSTAKTLWVPAVNNHGGFGRWDFIEIRDPWDAKNAITVSLRKPPDTTL